MPWQAEAAKEAATRRAPVSAPAVSVVVKARPIRAPCGTIDRHGANRSAHPGQRGTRSVLCEAHTRGVDACPSELSLRGCSDSVRSAPPPRRRIGTCAGVCRRSRCPVSVCRRPMPTPSRQAASAPSAWCRTTTRLRTTVACEARLVGRSVLRQVPLRCVCAQVLVAAAKGQEGCDDGRLAAAPALVPRARRAQRSGRFGSGCGELGSVMRSPL